MPQLGRPYNFLALATTNIKKVKSGDGVISRVIAANLSAETRFVKLYDTEAEPNLASDKPFVTIPVAKEAITPITLDLPFTRNLWHAITKKGEDTNAEATAAGDVRVTIITS